jgi:hypothetical protein
MRASVPSISAHCFDARAAAAGPVGMATASDAVKELAALCKASDSVLEKINELHGKLYKAGRLHC